MRRECGVGRDTQRAVGLLYSRVDDGADRAHSTAGTVCRRLHFPVLCGAAGLELCEVSQLDSASPRIVTALGRFGFTAIVLAVVCLAGSFLWGGEMLRAFFLGAFFCGLIGAILLFGMAKLIALLTQNGGGDRPTSNMSGH